MQRDQTTSKYRDYRAMIHNGRDVTTSGIAGRSGVDLSSAMCTSRQTSWEKKRVKLRSNVVGAGIRGRVSSAWLDARPNQRSLAASHRVAETILERDTKIAINFVRVAHVRSVACSAVATANFFCIDRNESSDKASFRSLVGLLVS